MLQLLQQKSIKSKTLGFIVQENKKHIQFEEIIINDRAKLENIKILLNYLIDTCKSEISITDKLIINARNNTDVSKLLKEKAFWEGKLEVAEYVKFFAK